MVEMSLRRFMSYLLESLPVSGNGIVAENRAPVKPTVFHLRLAICDWRFAIVRL